MIVLPAIDLYGGKVVRLTKGDFARKTEYGDNPCDLARGFMEKGCTHLHVVDLEGAERGEPKHLNVLSDLAGLGMFVEYGGGLRSRRAIRDALDAGAGRVMVGSLLFGKGEDMAKDLYAEFGIGIMPSIDVRAGKVVHSGWMEQTDLEPDVCLGCLAAIGYKTFLVTGVDRDGMLAGPDVDLYRPLVGRMSNIVAAGGVTTVEDIEKLAKIGVAGAVVGKALYEKNFDLEAALNIAGNQVC